MIEKITLPGLANMTSIMAFCASQKTTLSGAYTIQNKR